MTEGPLNSLLLKIIPPILALVMRVWFFTCRVTLHNPENLFQPHQQRHQAIASFWHYSIIYTFYFLRKYSATVMVSASRDG
ncbi:MAG: lysophospholipid acyltransferase family protein, partial [Desulforhopalus sp.]